MNLSHIDQGPLRVLRDVLRAHAQKPIVLAGTLADLLDEALAESPRTEVNPDEDALAKMRRNWENDVAYYKAHLSTAESDLTRVTAERDAIRKERDAAQSAMDRMVTRHSAEACKLRQETTAAKQDAEEYKRQRDVARSALAEANSTLAHFSLRSGERCAGTHSTREALKAALRYSVDLNPTTDFASPESVYQGLQPMLASVVGTYRDFAKEALHAVEKDEVALVEAQAEVAKNG